MPSHRARTALLLLALVAGVLAALVGTGSAAQATAGPHPLAVHRGGPAVTVPFVALRDGEALLDVTPSAPAADWGVTGRESAVVSVLVDGRYATDIVIPFATGVQRQFQLGAVRLGVHRVSFILAGDRTPSGVDSALLARPRVHVLTPRDAGYLAAAYAPVLYGRNLPAYGGPLANATTDTPLVAWHDVLPAATPGHRVLQFDIVWSNEDGGTDTPRLMARWGRTTDIEWIYRVEIDGAGRRVPGSDTFQAPAHTTTGFAGRYEGTHAVLDTCTENNNVCDTVDDPMRFFLSAQQTLQAGQPREALMDANPWTYQVMAAEMRREGKLEAVPSADTAQISNQRDYLFLAVRKVTEPAANSGASWVGVALGVTLRGSDRVYRSDHLGTGGATDWSVQRDDPAATTVELPAGTTADDVTGVVAYRVVNGTSDPGNAVHVERLIRGFFLGADDEPGSSFVSGTVDATLTTAAPAAVAWRR